MRSGKYADETSSRHILEGIEQDIPGLQQAFKRMLLRVTRP